MTLRIVRSATLNSVEIYCVCVFLWLLLKIVKKLFYSQFVEKFCKHLEFRENSSGDLIMTSDATQDFNGDNATKPKKKFICGVIEGFYGRPWTTEQRKDLFRKYDFKLFRLCILSTNFEKIWWFFFGVFEHRLKRWGMDSYVYAPKDDYKHRAYWREMYTVEEADHLTSKLLNI